MGQLRLAEHTVADGIDAGDIGLHPVVDQNAAAVIADTARLQVQRRRIGLPADGHQHFLRLKRNGIAASGGADHLCPHRGRLHGLHRAFQVELHAHLLHVGYADLGQVAAGNDGGALINDADHAVHSIPHLINQALEQTVRHKTTPLLSQKIAVTHSL